MAVFHQFLVFLVLVFEQCLHLFHWCSRFQDWKTPGALAYIDDSADHCDQILRLSFLGALDFKIGRLNRETESLVRNVVRDFTLPSRTAVLDIVPVS